MKVRITLEIILTVDTAAYSDAKNIPSTVAREVAQILRAENKYRSCGVKVTVKRGDPL